MPSTTKTAPSIRPGAKLSTAEAAKAFLVAPQTPRASLCRHGHWMGLKPVKLPNGRLLWDAAEVACLVAGRGAK